MWQARVEELLARKIGLDPGSIGAKAIQKAVTDRATAIGMANPRDYVDLLAESSDELQALVECVVVRESWFFRDRQPFALLQRWVRERWVDDPARAPLRALSLPCAGGEEPYSIALTLIDAGLPPPRFSIVAVDVSERSLEQARRGIYGPFAFRGFEVPHVGRYFHPIYEGVEIDRGVKDRVRFLQANFLDGDLLVGEPCFDVIFFRNLLIYLNAAARDTAMKLLDRLLAPSGIIFAGHAEALAIFSPRFVAIDEPGCFAFRRVPGQPAAAAFPCPPAPPKPATEPRRPPPTPPRPAPAEIRTPLPRTIEAAVPSALERASELANQRRYDEAIRLCEQVTRAPDPTARSYFLLGTIHQAAGNAGSAEACFLKAVYLDGQHDEALLALALLAERRGDQALAAGYRRRAERASRREQSP